MTYFLLILCVLGLSTGQVLFKHSANILKTLDTPWKLAFEVPFIGALFIYGLTTLGWVWALQDIPLSRAYMIMALAFVIVPLLSFYFFSEPLTFKFGLGVVFIVLGVLLTIDSK
ncbi:MAG: 4-amino-4-deoxy-L-arabinose-phospho-UDP flippase [Alphaproteobacteria bacterium]|nr:4-amino-4-deoxy-L-arabinose-phospho-UDP flippase [Alphaproteobacteria bacterium]